MFEKVFSKKNAMTLGELLVVFIIMGIIATMTIMSAKPGEKSLKYAYTQSLNALGTAFYNSTINPPAGFTGEFPQNQRDFCLMLTEFINTSDNRCNSLSAGASGININNNATTINDELNQKTPDFKASNGVWYWIGNIDAKPFASITLTNSKTPSSSQVVRYHVVIVDLNGSLGPNSVVWSKERIADRVAFIVTEEAEAIPLGAPEYDARYLTAKVVYNSMSGVEVEDQNSSRSMTYYEAKRNAWTPTVTSNPSAIYRSTEELFSYTFYQGGEGVTGGDVVKTTSPFFINYNTNTDIVNAATVNNNHDENCETGGEFDPEGCYVKITEYN